MKRQFRCTPEQSVTYPSVLHGTLTNPGSSETGTAVDAAHLDFSKAEDVVCNGVLKAKLLRHHGLLAGLEGKHKIGRIAKFEGL